MSTKFGFTVGQKVKVIGNSSICTESIDGLICTIVDLRENYAVVQEDCPAKYNWWVYYSDIVPIKDTEVPDNEA